MYRGAGGSQFAEAAQVVGEFADSASVARDEDGV
jgi:hypothetical protein